MTEQTYAYRGRPVVDHRLRDKVRKMMGRLRKADTKATPAVPEHMAGKVHKAGAGYRARVYIHQKPYNGPIRETPELAYRDWPHLYQRAKQVEAFTAHEGAGAFSNRSIRNPIGGFGTGRR